MPAGKNGTVESVIIGLAALAAAVVLLATARRRGPGGETAEASEAVRRDLSRLIDELRAGVREQVERLDREVKRIQAAVADAERVRHALEEARDRAAPSPSAKATGDRPPAAPPAKAAANPLHSRVFELRDSGKEPADIGVETGLEVGEVELILGLRRMPPRA